MKKLAWLFVILSALNLPNLHTSLYASLVNTNGKWRVWSYWDHLMTPAITIQFIMTAAILTLAMVLIAKLYYRGLIKAVIAIPIGTTMTALLYQAVLKLADYATSSDKYILFYTDKHMVVSLLFMSFFTTLAGIAFGKPIAVEGGNNPAIKTILKILLSPFIFAGKILGQKKNRE